MGKERNDLANAKKVKDGAILTILVSAGGFILKMAKTAHDNKKLTAINGELSDINGKFIKTKKDKERKRVLEGQRGQYNKDD